MKKFIFMALSFSLVYGEGDYLPLNEAISRTLTQQKQIQISVYNINNQEGVFQSSAAPFDMLISENVSDGFGNTVQRDPNARFTANDFSTQATITKVTRPGTAFTLNGFYEYYTSKPANTRATQVFFQVTQPLLRNFLNGINRQTEEANFLELQAVNFDTLQTISNTVLTTINSYWSYLAAEQTRAVIENAIKRIENIQSLTQKLIEGEQLAAEDINQPLAVLISQKQNLAQIGGNVFTAKQQLLFAMGNLDEAAKGTFDQAVSVGKFLPSINLDEINLEKRKDELIRLAFDRRFDVKAAELREEETRTLLIGAENQTLPELDIIGGATVTDLHPVFQLDNIVFPGTFFSFQDTAAKKNFAMDYSVGLSLTVPLHNDNALGFLKQIRAKRAQSILQTELLKQNLISMVLQLIYNQMFLHSQLRQANDTVEKYTRLVQDETEKLQAGFSSVFVLLNFESSLIAAQVTLVGLLNQYIQGIANLRYYTGTLIESHHSVCEINVEDVLSYPE